ncbi:MAG: hypothetical protein IT430_13565 [Phycisphaerales bacterium]|nr:hypothetical protein [Phycisphaerales bacterium]
MVLWLVTSWLLFGAALGWAGWFVGRRVWRRRRFRLYCESCGYDLRGGAAPRCTECGHDTSRPMRLIRFRRALLHSMVVFALLTASHLVYRVEAIQKRGWIAAVPTTVLIALLPFERGSTDYEGSVLVQEVLSFRAQRADAAPDAQRRSVHGPEYPMARWQWWCAIEMALKTEFTFFDTPTCWQMSAEWLLNAAESADAATRDQLRRILDVVVLDLRTRPQWPEGVEMRADFGVLSIDSGWRFDFEIHPLEPHRHLASFRPTGTSSGTYPDWNDYTDVLGMAESLGPVQYEFIIQRRDGTEHPWRELSREIRTVTTVVPADTPLLDPILIADEVVAGIGVRMKIIESPLPGSESCLVYLNFVRNRSLIDAVGAGTFAVRIRLKLNGELVGESIGWWSNRLPWKNSVDRDEWIIEYDLDNELLERARKAGHSDWSLEIEGDPILALRDFQSTSYWAGKHEFRNIPVERVESGK